MNQSQRQIVLEQLKTGSVSRNWCLERRITRLGAIICALQKEGWEFDAQYINKDYLYKVKCKKDPHHLQGKFDNACIFLKGINPTWEMSKELIEIGRLKKNAELELIKLKPEDYIINNFLDRAREMYKKLSTSRGVDK